MSSWKENSFNKLRKEVTTAGASYMMKNYWHDASKIRKICIHNCILMYYDVDDGSCFDLWSVDIDMNVCRIICEWILGKWIGFGISEKILFDYSW